MAAEQPRLRNLPPPSSKMLGEGTFGRVFDRGNGEVDKYFENLDYLIQEVIVTKYMNDSPYTIKFLRYNLRNLTMTTQKWEICLKDAMLKVIPYEKKYPVFHKLLKALSHLHRRLIIHSDFKPSNILLNVKGKDEIEVAIADMGLSSTTNYGKVLQTAPAYRPDIIRPITHHDMFGLAVSMTEFLADFDFKHRLTAERLRYHIHKNFSGEDNKTFREVLTSMCPDDPAEAITAAKALEVLFGETCDIGIPEVHDFPPRITDKRDLEYIKTTIVNSMKKARINRDLRCYYAFLIYANNPDNKLIKIDEFPLYIGVIIMIFSSMFGEAGYGINEVMISLKEFKFRKEHIYAALENFINDQNFINYIMMPDLRKADS